MARGLCRECYNRSNYRAQFRVATEPQPPAQNGMYDRPIEECGKCGSVTIRSSLITTTKLYQVCSTCGKDWYIRLAGETAERAPLAEEDGV